MSDFMKEKLEKMKGENPALYEYLHSKSDSDVTFMKYQRIVSDFKSYLVKKGITIDTATKADIVDYANYLKEHTKSINYCNNKLSILNVYFASIRRKDLEVLLFRTMKKDFIDDNRFLDKKDFYKLDEKSKRDIELNAMIHTLAGIGIRVSELKFVTYEAVKLGEVTIDNKKKTRTIAIPHKLKMKLLDYCKSKGIVTGYLFTSDGIHPYCRGTIWSKLKALAKLAGVILTKVFPHAFRKLFARLNYKRYKDIESLKTMLGHSRIATTLLYLMQTKQEYANKVDVGLIE